MRVVADASILTEASRLESAHARAWLVDLLQGDQFHDVAGLTLLEVSSALRKLVFQGHVDDRWAEEVNRRLIELPLQHERLTQANFSRIWELRFNLTAYDAAYVAVTETLQAHHGGAVVLATADERLFNAPGLSCPMRFYPGP